jgi:hypothetical protein
MPLGGRRSEQCLVSGHHDEVWIVHSMRCRQVYSVIAPKTVRLCELPG